MVADRDSAFDGLALPADTFFAGSAETPPAVASAAMIVRERRIAFSITAPSDRETSFQKA